MTRKEIKQYLPLVTVIVLTHIAYFSGIYTYLNVNTLKDTHESLRLYADTHTFLTPLIFLGIYIATVVLCLPGPIFLCVVAGFLFAQPYATLYVVAGATIGSFVFFIIANTAVGELIFKKAGPRLRKLELGIEKNAQYYLLCLRFAEVVPFWLVNVAAAFFRIKPFVFLWTTAVGFLPSAFVFSEAGRGLHTFWESGKEFSLSEILNPEMRIALYGLGVLALLPILFKRWRKKH